MEPTETHTDDTEARQAMDDHLEKIVQDFNEFREKMSGQVSGQPMKLEDLVDLYIDTSCENSHGESQTINAATQLTTQQQDLHCQPHVGPTDDTEIQESFQTFDENVISNFDLGLEGDRVTYIRYGDLNCDGAAGEFIGSVFGGEVNFWWWWMGATARRERVKRKYTRAVEKDEDAACRVRRE